MGYSRFSVMLNPGRLPSQRCLHRLSISYSPNSTREISSTCRLLANKLPASYYRGGTSRAVFFQIKDLPKDRSEWSSIFLGVLGSPDRYGRQLDGMGGGISSLSKICIVGPPTRSDADVDYTFVSVGVKDADVDYSSNCGNMISAVGPFAIDSRLVDASSSVKDSDDNSTDTDMRTVRIHNTNTGKTINSTFPIDPSTGDFEPSGKFSIDGVSSMTSSRIQLDFIDPVGSRTGKLLPTGSKIDEFDGISATCIDVGNPCCFVSAEELGVKGDMTPSEIEAHSTLLERLESIRRQAGVKMGLGTTTVSVPGSVPKICLISPIEFGSADAPKADLQVRAISVGQPHKAVPITVSLSTATAARLPGTIVHKYTAAKPIDPVGVTIAHASGTLMIGAKFASGGELEYATVFRTARRLMEGMVYWK